MTNGTLIVSGISGSATTELTSELIGTLSSRLNGVVRHPSMVDFPLPVERTMEGVDRR